MSDIFREVDEAMQKDKMLAIWEEHKTTIIAAIVLMLLTASATTIYQNWNSSRNNEETARLLNAMESDNPAEALPAIIKDSRNKHAAVAQFIAAGLAIEDGKNTEAAALYKDAATDKSTPRDLRDLARVLYVQNAEQPAIDILQPLLANKKSPWIWHARIEAAVITAHSKDNYAQAINYIKDFETVTTIPLSLKQRGNALRHVYEIKQAKAATSKESATNE